MVTFCKGNFKNNGSAFKWAKTANVYWIENNRMKCPQLNKPEATAARNENSIGDRMEKKPWEKPGSVGGQFPSDQMNQ